MPNYWSRSLYCCWTKIVPIDDYSIAIHLVPGDCVDMSGAINVAQAINDQVSVIFTYSGDDQDTTYRRLPDGNWEAMLVGRLPKKEVL